MTRGNGELDEYGKRVFAPLLSAPPIDPQTAAAEKSQFLLQGEYLRLGFIPQAGEIYPERDHQRIDALRGKQPIPLVKALIATLLVLFILVGSSVTVFAAQSSLPGDPLYTIKSWSEDVRLSMTISKKAKLDLTLDYTNRRMDEISNLVADGKTLPDQTSVRFQGELENAIELAAQMDDTQMQLALGQIKHRAESQGMTIENLIKTLPPQAEPAILRLQQRLIEQVQLSTFGQGNPQAFRSQIHERLHKQQGPKKSPTPGQSMSTPTEISNTPLPKQEDNGIGNGNGKSQPTEVPGHGGPGKGQGQPTPGNGNHEPELRITPVP
jgi:Domain of unknown function (DUF5667)